MFKRGGSPSFSLKGGGRDKIEKKNGEGWEKIKVGWGIGTAGLLLNEFVWEHSTTRTIIFAIVNFVGLVNLAFAHFGYRGKTA